MTYFNHSYVSNSDLKKIVARDEGRIEIENLQAIYDFGTAFHGGITEPHKALNLQHEVDNNLISQMHQTFWRDELCRKIAMQSDFRREHEFYRVNRFGLKGVRCKCDGDSRSLRVILELKGLSVTTEKAFKESIEHLDYDQGAAWYLNVTDSGGVVVRPNYDYKLIAGISKKEPDRMFKILIDRNHQFYKNGMIKIKKAVRIWKGYGFE